MNKLEPLKEGWKYLYNARKWHYFCEDGNPSLRSLCRMWGAFNRTGLEQGNDESPDNCKACRKALLKRAAV